MYFQALYSYRYYLDTISFYLFSFSQSYCLSTTDFKGKVGNDGNDVDDGENDNDIDHDDDDDDNDDDEDDDDGHDDEYDDDEI